MFDTHLHCNFSTDSNMKIEEAVEFSKENKMGLIVTEHMDLKYPVPNKFIFDIPSYFKEYEKFRSENFLLGVEIGMRMNCIDENRNVAYGHAFDYIIGSVHLVNDKDIYYDEYYNNKTKIQAYREYLFYILQCLKQHTFIDSLGHIDYICRYAKYENKELYYEEYKEVIDEILSILISNNIAIEINTRRFENRESINSLIPIYKRYKELGGQFVTIGSDAHFVNKLGKNIKIGFDIAEICNLKVVYFKERKLFYDKI